MTSVVSLGRLERVELRSAWPHEAGNFTPWLAQQENLDLLGDALGMELAFEAAEKPVENFSADILAKDVATERWVLIENQLEQTDHSHLGQILTYAAGLDASTIIWIAKEFREPHRAAIDYLNHISGSEFNFFAVQIELFRIGESALAPRFNVLAKPNDWSREVLASASNRAAQSERSLQWREYWQKFLAVADARGLKVVTKTPPKEGWCRIEQLLKGEISAGVWAHSTNTKLRAVVWMTGESRHVLFDRLYEQRDLLSQQMGLPLFWDRGDAMKSSFLGVEVARTELALGSTQTLEQEFDWFITQTPRLASVLRSYV